MRQILLMSLLLCLFLQVACNKGNETTTHAAKEPPRTMSDADLKKMIEEKVNSDPQLQAANLDISADAERNMATVSGKVESDTLRTKAIDLAKSAHEGVVVADNISVTPREITRAEYTAELARAEVERARSNKETVGSSIDDAWIHSKIVAKLVLDSDTPERKINVDVYNGVVTLRGTVNSAAEKEEAVQVAKDTDGVKRVNNMLKVATAKTGR